MKLCNKLPQDVLSHIYEYDSTYKTAFREPTFAEELLLKSWDIKIDHIFKYKKVKKHSHHFTYNITQMLKTFINKHLFIINKNEHKTNILQYIEILNQNYLKLKEINNEYLLINTILFDNSFCHKKSVLKYNDNNYNYDTKVFENNIINILFSKIIYNKNNDFIGEYTEYSVVITKYNRSNTFADYSYLEYKKIKNTDEYKSTVIL